MQRVRSAAEMTEMNVVCILLFLTSVLVHALAPYPQGRLPEFRLNFCVLTCKPGNCAGHSPATVELDFASSIKVRV
jgi:hypothetical protein